MKTTVNSARRGFLRKAGAAIAAPLAVGAASASARAPGDRDAQARLAQLEDVNAIRELTRSYVRHVNAGAHGEAAALFAQPAHADARFALTTLATPIEPVTPLVEMARAQGGGFLKRSERGLLEGVYVKRDGCWKIGRLAFRAS